MKNRILEVTYEFAKLIVMEGKELIEIEREYILSKQLIRSGTSIGANVREAQSAESNSDFIHKLSIALKEARETEYWIMLLADCEYLDHGKSELLGEKCMEIIKILTAIILTLKRKNRA